MKYWVSIALVAMVAAIFSSASWAGDNGKAKGNAFGHARDGNPKYSNFSQNYEAKNQGIANANEHIPANACGNSDDREPLTGNKAPGKCPLNPLNP